MQPLFCNLHQNEDSHCARATVLDQVIYKASSKQSKIHQLQIISLLTSHSIERVMDWKIVTQGWNVVGNICHLSWLTSSIMGRWWPGNVIFVKGRRLSVIWSRGVNYAPQGSELSAPGVWRITQIVAQVRISVLNTFTGLVLFLPLTYLPDDIFPPLMLASDPASLVTCLLKSSVSDKSVMDWSEAAECTHLCKKLI